MAKFGSNSLIVAVDNSSGSVVTMTSYITSINAIEVEAILTESHSFGDAWFEQLATGVRKASDLVLGGLYDDTSTTGPDAIFNDVADGPSDSTRTVTITFGGSKTCSFEAIISKYTRTATRNELTAFEVTLVPTGTVTEA
ncbi:MAG: hypothetical protein VX246_13955 [Myxococcota bacterium]|nr:hypothetical protein [Myxococcota bacterium]